MLECCLLFAFAETDSAAICSAGTSQTHLGLPVIPFEYPPLPTLTAALHDRSVNASHIIHAHHHAAIVPHRHIIFRVPIRDSLSLLTCRLVDKGWSLRCSAVHGKVEEEVVSGSGW